MKIFKEFNQIGKPCPICLTKDSLPTTLVAVKGTEQDGIMEAIQVHVDCLPDFQFDPEMNVFIAIRKVANDKQENENTTTILKG